MASMVLLFFNVFGSNVLSFRGDSQLNYNLIPLHNSIDYESPFSKEIPKFWHFQSTSISYWSVITFQLAPSNRKTNCNFFDAIFRWVLFIIWFIFMKFFQWNSYRYSLNEEKGNNFNNEYLPITRYIWTFWYFWKYYKICVARHFIQRLCFTCVWDFTNVPKIVWWFSLSITILL